MTADTQGGNAVPSLTLQLWQCLDWRFLLPVSDLGAIGYTGNPSAETVCALQLLDPDARDLADYPSVHAARRCDVVFAERMTRSTVREVSAALIPGGWLYAQVRPSLRVGRGEPVTVWGWQRALRRAGFVDIKSHWHTPDLTSCLRITPLDSPTAVRGTLSRYQGVRFGALKAVLGRLALSVGLIGLVVPAGSVIGRRPLTGEHQR